MKLSEINKALIKLEDLNVLVIGDTILDQYVFATPKGRAVKDPILSTEYKSQELYSGGVLAIANHVAGFVKRVRVVTLFGEKKHEFDVFNNMKKLCKTNVTLKYFIKEDAYTTLKKRYVSPYRNEKLFKMEYITDTPISEKLEKEISTHIKGIMGGYDLIIVADFGHGFLTNKLRSLILSSESFVAVNSQNNSSNMGFNYFTNYIDGIGFTPNFMTMTEEEIRLPMQMRFDNIHEVIKKVYEKHGLKHFFVTLGKKGSIYFDDGRMIEKPAFVNNPKDTMGAGDALFSMTSLLSHIKADPEMIALLGNVAGGLAAETLGNKDSITPDKILSFIKEKKVLKSNKL